MVPEQIANYPIRRQLTTGDSVAELYLATDPDSGNQVTLKLLAAQLMYDAAFAANFEREARLLVGLKHSTLVPVLNAGVHDGRAFLVRRHMSGGALRKRLADGPLSVSEAAKLMRRIAAGLDYLHSQMVTHRNVGAHAILFDEFGDAYLSEFDIAHLYDVAEAQGFSRDTAYLSPEQAAGDEMATRRSDVYALGMLFFEMISGQRPYQGDAAAVRRQHIEAPVPSLGNVRPMYRAFDAPLSRALAKSPDDRYATAGQLAAALSQVASQFSSSPRMESVATMIDDTPLSPPDTAPQSQPVVPPPVVAQPQPRVQPQPESLPSFQSPAAAVNQQPAPEKRGGGPLMWLLGCGGVLVLGVIATVVAFFAYGQLSGDPATEVSIATATPADSGISGGVTEPPAPTATPQPTEPPFVAQYDEIAARAAYYGPIEGALAYRENGEITSVRTGVDLQDFILESTFFAPYDFDDGPWDYGFLFRHAGYDDQYRLIIESNGDWVLNDRQGTTDQTIDSGRLSNLNTDPSVPNTVRLVADGPKGYFFLNGELVAELDLSRRLYPGDVFAASALFVGNEIIGEQLRYDDISLWALPRDEERLQATATVRDAFANDVLAQPSLIGPLSGELTHLPDNDVIEIEYAGVNVTNFVTEATFFNPYSTEAGRYDYGFLFRADDDFNSLWVTVESTGNWRVESYIDGQFDFLDGGHVIPNSGVNQANQIVLVVDGSIGYMYFNGSYAGEFDTGALFAPGDVIIGTGLTIDRERSGASTVYEDWRVWEIP